MANLGYSFLLVLTAFLWGSTFVAQVEGNSVGPFTFVCIRNFIATAVLFGLAKILDKLGKSPRRPKNSAEKKLLWKAGIFCGLAMFCGMNLQQSGIFLGTPAGKAGFFNDLLHYLRPDFKPFPRQKKFVQNLVLRFTHSLRALSALH